MSKSSFAKIVVCMFFLVMAIPIEVHADTPPPEAQRAAEEGLARFLATIPAEELARMGLATAEDIQAATLGAPYEQFTLTPQALAAYESGMSLSPLLTSTDTWLFPVMVHGEARTMLTVAMVNGQWEAGDIGGTYLPAALQRAEANLPTLMEQKGVTSEYTARFVRVFQVYADFLVVQAGETAYMLPLMPDPSRFNLEADTLVAPDQVLPQLNALVGQTLEEKGEALGGGVDASSEAGGAVDPAPAETGVDTAQNQAAEGSSEGSAASSAPAETGADTIQRQGVPNLLLYSVGAMAVLALGFVVIGSVLVILGRRKQA